jgi:hypothetical protein
MRYLQYYQKEKKIVQELELKGGGGVIGKTVSTAKTW